VPVKNDPLGRLELDCRFIHEEPIFLSFTSDLFQRSPYRPITMNALRIIKYSGNRIRILTKGFIPPEMLRKLGKGDEVGATFTFLSDDDQILWEPRAASSGARLANVKRAWDLGIGTWASFEPVIDPEQTLLLIKLAAPYIDIAKIGMANHTASWDWPSEEWRERVASIDWPDFRRRAIKLCESLGLNYYIKADLREAR
jgi:DNA repair photolyase